MTETVLQEAERLINGQRREDYGSVEESFVDIASRWTQELKGKLTEDITPFDVVHLMVQLKLSRAKNGFLRDSYVDVAGYVGLTEKLNEIKAEQEVKQSASDFSEGDVFTPTRNDKGRWRVENGRYRYIYDNGEVTKGEIGLWGKQEVDHYAPFKRANPTGPYTEVLP